MVALVCGSGLLGIWFFGLVDAAAAAGVGLVIGGVLAVVVCHHSRRWIRWLRLRLMASHVITATATLCANWIGTRRTEGRRTAPLYTVWFSWTDSVGGPPAA